jgi:hypothetical protein
VFDSPTAGREKKANPITPPKYDLEIVEGAVLEITVELHPQLLTMDELILKVVGDADDQKEIATAARAIGGLQDVGLYCRRDDEIVQLTPAALHAVKLLGG